MNLNEPELVKKYGSWIRVQVAFYDFLFKKASNLCATHWNQLALEERMTQFKDGGDLYERTVSWIEKNYEQSETAWNEFIHEVNE